MLLRIWLILEFLIILPLNKLYLKKKVQLEVKNNGRLGPKTLKIMEKNKKLLQILEFLTCQQHKRNIIINMDMVRKDQLEVKSNGKHGLKILKIMEKNKKLLPIPEFHICPQFKKNMDINIIRRDQ